MSAPVYYRKQSILEGLQRLPANPEPYEEDAIVETLERIDEELWGTIDALDELRVENE